MALVLVLGVGAAIPAASAPVEALGGAAQRAAPVGVGAGVGVLGAASSPFTVGGRVLTPVALTATSPSRADSALTGASATGSERIADLMREIRRVQARLEVASTQAQIRAEERDDAATELAGARSVASAAKSDLRTVRTQVPSAIAANRSARKARRAAISERRSARAASTQADAQLATTQAHLDSLTQAAQRAEARVRRKARRVEKAATGTADWQKAFTSWQMAAVEDRSAHARRVLAEDQAVEAFVAQQAAEATRTRAESAAVQAKRARWRAKAAKDAAILREAELTEERAASRIEVKARRAAHKSAESALDEAQALATRLTTRLAALRAQVAEYENHLAGGSR